MQKIANGLDFNKSEIANARIQNLGSAPASPATGQFWYNTTDGYVYYRNATTDVAICTLAQLVATRLDQFAAPTASVSLNSQKIVNLLNPTNAQDAATKAYVDGLVQGLKWKDPVRLASTSALTLSGLTAIDGITPVAGDRIARMDNSASAGIYVAAAGAWTRSLDADIAAEVLGMTFHVLEGTANANKIFTQTVDAPITLETTALSFSQIGSGTSYSQGTGISIAGSTIAIDTALVPRKYSTTIGNGSLTSITVTHNLGTSDVVVSLRKVSSGDLWLPDVTVATTNSITLAFGTAPTTNEFSVLVLA